MISVKDEKISVNGCKVELMAELTALIKMLVDDDDFDWEDIAIIVETAKMSPEQLDDAISKSFDEIIKWLENL